MPKVFWILGSFASSKPTLSRCHFVAPKMPHFVFDIWHMIYRRFILQWEWPSEVLLPPSKKYPSKKKSKNLSTSPTDSYHCLQFDVIFVGKDALWYHTSPAIASASKQRNHHLGAKTRETCWSVPLPTVCRRLVDPGRLPGTTCLPWLRHGPPCSHGPKIAAKQRGFDGGISRLWRWWWGHDRSTRFNHWRVGTCRSWNSMDRFVARKLCTSYSDLGFSGLDEVWCLLRHPALWKGGDISKDPVLCAFWGPLLAGLA